MSKPTDRKKARRQKRLAERVVWARMAEQLDDDPDDDREAAAEIAVGLVAELELFHRRITDRNWTYDSEHSVSGVASWYFAPSGCDSVRDDAEPVTRVWASHEDFPDCVHVIAVGSLSAQKLSPAEFFDKVADIEAYRAEHSLQA